MIRKCERFAILARDKYRCVYCGRSPLQDSNVVLQIDHLKPQSKGGTDKSNNLVTSCRDCNIGKGNRYNTVNIRKVVVNDKYSISRVILHIYIILKDRIKEKNDTYILRKKVKYLNQKLREVRLFIAKYKKRKEVDVFYDCFKRDLEEGLYRLELD